MQRIIYYVAMSLDGYITGPNEDISQFSYSGPLVDQYVQDLQSFQTVIMGRKTYEFGYNFGLVPGQPAYPHMMHYIFSETLSLKVKHPQVHILSSSIETLKQIKLQSPTAIYLCGGSLFAGWLLSNRLIDEIRIKLNPIILGEGRPLFDGIKQNFRIKMTNSHSYEDGMQLLAYNIIY